MKVLYVLSILFALIIFPGYTFLNYDFYITYTKQDKINIAPSIITALQKLQIQSRLRRHLKKIVLRLDLQDDTKAKQKALKTVSTLPGIDSIAMDMKEKILTVIGTMDPVGVVSKLRKHWPSTDIILVGPAKEPEKEKKEDEPKKEEAAANKEEAKKDEPKKEEEKKDEPKKDEGKKEDEKKPDPVSELVKAYKAYNPQMTTNYYVQSIEENPNACCIS